MRTRVFSTHKNRGIEAQAKAGIMLGPGPGWGRNLHGS